MNQILALDYGLKRTGIAYAESPLFIAHPLKTVKTHDLLILDEPTASLDKDNETKVINSLKSAWQDKTVIMLTHKLSFLECVDQIIVLANGKIVQQGSFDELVEQKDKEFYSFYKNEVVL